MNTENIFEEAANQSKKQNKQQPVQKKSSSVKKKNSSELEQMVQKLNEMENDIQQKLQFIYDTGKKCQIDVELFFSQPGLFSQEDINNYIKSKRELENFIANSPSSSPADTSSKSTERGSQKRKDKTRGMRKKWIPMP